MKSTNLVFAGLFAGAALALAAAGASGCEILSTVDRSKVGGDAGLGGSTATGTGGATSTSAATGTGGMPSTSSASTASSGGAGGGLGGSGGGLGGSGGATSSAGTGGAPCTNPATDCPPTDTECFLATCNADGTCGTADVADLTPVTMQTAGDCSKIVCDGAGMTKSVPDGNDVADDMNECTVDACNNGAPTHLPLPAGTVCSMGGKVCSGNGACVECVSNGDCTGGGTCQMNACAAPSCSDGVKNGNETDVDCGGGACPKCANNLSCSVPTDCASSLCVAGKCAASPCSNGVKDANESDVDCGGLASGCPKCGPNKACGFNSDCAGGSCGAGLTCTPNCQDGVKDNNEADVDCGGGASGCALCVLGKTCTFNNQCFSQSCGGTCVVSNTCFNNMKDTYESDIDCGGGACAACAAGKKCNANSDCASSSCNTAVVPHICN